MEFVEVKLELECMDDFECDISSEEIKVSFFLYFASLGIVKHETVFCIM